MATASSQTPLTKALLCFLRELGDTAIDFVHLAESLSSHYGSAYSRGGYEYVAELKQLAKEQKLRQIVYALRRSKYIKAAKVGSRFMLELTEKGKAATLLHQLRTSPWHRENTYTIVIFDIPETQRAARLQFRQLLKAGGFKLLQHSVWISQRDSYKVVADFITRLRLKRWVNVYHATDLLHSPPKKT